MASHLDTIYEEEDSSEICFGEEYPTVLLASDQDLHLSIELSRLLGDDLNTAILEVSDDDEDTRINPDDSCNMDFSMLNRSFCVFQDSASTSPNAEKPANVSLTDSDYGTDQLQTSSSADSSITNSQCISSPESATDQPNWTELRKSINDSSGDQENLGIQPTRRRLRSNSSTSDSKRPLAELKAKDIVSIQFEVSSKVD